MSKCVCVYVCVCVCPLRNWLWGKEQHQPPKSRTSTTPGTPFEKSAVLLAGFTNRGSGCALPCLWNMRLPVLLLLLLLLLLGQAASATPWLAKHSASTTSTPTTHCCIAIDRSFVPLPKSGNTNSENWQQHQQNSPSLLLTSFQSQHQSKQTNKQTVTRPKQNERKKEEKKKKTSKNIRLHMAASITCVQHTQTQTQGKAQRADPADGSVGCCSRAQSSRLTSRGRSSSSSIYEKGKREEGKGGGGGGGGNSGHTHSHVHESAHNHNLTHTHAQKTSHTAREGGKS